MIARSVLDEVIVIEWDEVEEIEEPTVVGQLPEEIQRELTRTTEIPADTLHVLRCRCGYLPSRDR